MDQHESRMGGGLEPRSLVSIPPLPHLCCRERQTLYWLLRGRSKKEIAVIFGVSRNTLNVYVKGLFRRFHVCTQNELLAYFLVPVADALEDRLLSPDGGKLPPTVLRRLCPREGAIPEAGWVYKSP